MSELPELRVDVNQTKTNSKRSRLECILATGIWFLLTLFIALPQGLKTRIGVINIANNSSPDLIRKAWGPRDAGSLLDTAITWSKFHQIDATTQFWIVHLWTPGMSVIEIPLIWISKIGLPIFWSLLFITLLTWSTIFWFIWRYISPIIGRVPCVSVVLILITSWDFRYFFREDLFYTEGLSFGFLVLGIGLISWEYSMSSMRHYLYMIGGILIGISIMIRYVSDIGILILFIVGSFSLLFQFKKSNIPLNHEENSKQKQNKKISTRELFKKIWSLNIFGVWLSCVIAFMFTVPWRLMSYLIFHGPFLTLSSASDLVGPSLWLPNSKLGFWRLSGMNWGCVIDPVKCSAINQSGKSVGSNSLLLRDGILSAVQHPLSFLSTRWHFLDLQWIPRDGITGWLYTLENISSILPILMLAGALVLFIRNRSSRKAAWIWIPLLLAEIAQLLIVHYESRYFIPVRLFALGFFMFTVVGEKVRSLDVRT